MVASSDRREICCAGVNGMKKRVAEWIQSVLGSEAEKTVATTPDFGRNWKMASAITPTTVPGFVIPKLDEGKLRNGSTRSEDSEDSLSLSVDSSEEMFTPVRPYRKVASLPCCMSDMVKDSEQEDEERFVGGAAHFPHLKKKTSSYGFTFVSEHPSTDRRESLLMGSASIEAFQQSQRNTRSYSEDQQSRPFKTHRKLTARHSESVLVGRRGRSRPSTLSQSLPTDAMSEHLYLRKRSSVTDLTADVVSRLQFSNDSPRYLSKIEAQKVAPLGELKLSLVYDQQTQQLHVTILKAENLLHLSADTECNAYVKVYLEPGKAVKQQTDVIRSSKNPTFQNSPLTFKNLSKADLKHKSIRLRVCNKMGSGMSLYAKRITIGEVVLPLNQLGLENGDEVRMWKGLEDTCEFQSLGTISTSLRLDAKEGQLHVTVLDAHIANASSTSSSYVRVCVTQAGRKDVKKETMVKKNGSSAIYNETFVFSVSTDLQDLDSIKINIKVMMKEKIKSDVVVGEAIIADSTTYLWNELYDAPNTQIKQCHEILTPEQLRLLAFT